MKLYLRIAIVLLILALGFGLIWAVAKYFASPPPSGETYHLVPNWPSCQKNQDRAGLWSGC